MTDPIPGDSFEGQYPTGQTYTVYSVDPDYVYLTDDSRPIPLRSWPHFVYDRQGLAYLGKDSVYTGTLQSLLQLEDDEFEVLGLYDHSLCFVTEGMFVKMSSPGYGTVEESLTRIRDEWNLVKELTEAGLGGILPCQWYQIGEKGFLLKPRACLNPLVGRQEEVSKQIQANLIQAGFDGSNLEWGTWNTIPFVLNVSSLL